MDWNGKAGMENVSKIWRSKLRRPPDVRSQCKPLSIYSAALFLRDNWANLLFIRLKSHSATEHTTRTEPKLTASQVAAICNGCAKRLEGIP